MGEDFGPSIDDVLSAQDEHSKLKVDLKTPNGSSSDAKTDEGKVGSKKPGQTNGTATYGATGNSATYGAAHTNQYQQYGSRYNQHYSASSGYGSQYNNYYGQSGYGGQTGNTGGSYGSSYWSKSVHPNHGIEICCIITKLYI